MISFGQRVPEKKSPTSPRPKVKQRVEEPVVPDQEGMIKKLRFSMMKQEDDVYFYSPFSLQPVDNVYTECP